MTKTFTYLLITVFTFISCSKGLVAEKEGNNSFETAQKIVIGVDGDIEDGLIGDYYSFEANPQHMIDIELNVYSNIPMSMTIFDHERNILKYVNDLPKNESDTNYSQVIRDIYVNKGVFYILLEGTENVEYSVNIKTREYRDSYENEPNDTFSNAQVFSFNDNIKYYDIDAYYSQISNTNVKVRGFENKEIDLYQITNSRDTPFIANLNISSVPSSDVSISLYDKNYRKIMTVDNNIEGDGERLEKLMLKPYSAYYVLVYGDDKNNNVPYKLSASVENTFSDIEFEPNNKIEESQEVYYDIRYKGAIDYILDTDYFMFVVPKRIILDISYFRIDFENINIKIFDFLYNEIRTLSKVEQNEEILFDEGIYYLRFSSDKVEKGEFERLNYEFVLSPLEIIELESVID